MLSVVTTIVIFYIIISTSILRWWTLYVESTLMKPPVPPTYSRVMGWFFGSMLQVIGKLAFFLVSTPTNLGPHERWCLIWMADAGSILLMNYYIDIPLNLPWYFTVLALPVAELVYYLFSKLKHGEEKEKSKTQ